MSKTFYEKIKNYFPEQEIEKHNSDRNVFFVIFKKNGRTYTAGIFERTALFYLETHSSLEEYFEKTKKNADKYLETGKM